jgi:hypothetical protein
MNQEGANVTLYTIPLEGGQLKKICQIAEKEPLYWIFRNQFISSLIWSNDDKKILYTYKHDIFQISADGNSNKKIYSANNKQMLSSYLQHWESDSVSFIVMEYTIPINEIKKLPLPVVCSYREKIDYNGTVLEHKAAPPMVSSNDRGYNFSVMTEDAFIWSKAWLGSTVWENPDILRVLYLTKSQTLQSNTYEIYLPKWKENCNLNYIPLFYDKKNQRIILSQFTITWPNPAQLSIPPTSLVYVSCKAWEK